MKSDLIRRTSFVVGAVLLALAVVILAVGPRTTYRAKASFTVSRPLLASDVVAEIRLADINARPAGGEGVEADATADTRAKARQRVVEAVQRAADECGATASSVALARADASQTEADRATTDAATVSASSGVTDPERAYQNGRAALDRLERQRADAQAHGEPVADLDIRIASAQEKMFDLEFLVKRLEALAEVQQRATRDAVAAKQAAKGSEDAAALMKHDVSIAEQRSSGWQGVALVLGALGALVVLVTAILALARRSARPRRRRVDVPRKEVRSPSAVPRAPMSAEDAVLVEETLVRARARRAGSNAASGLDNGHSTVDAAAGSAIDLVAEEQAESRQDAERPIGGA